MGPHNVLKTDAVCPRCGVCCTMACELRFGDTRGRKTVLVGDQYPWVPLKEVRNGGRPERGDLDGEGYAVCPRCGRMFSVKVLIRRDVIVGIAPDPDRSGYI